MSDLSDLLPTVSGEFEIAAAKAMSDELPVPIRQAVDPQAAPPAFLPFLAAHNGVRLWYSDWQQARKRLVIGESIIGNFEVGTRAGVERFLGYVDATLVDVISYPKRFVAGRAGDRANASRASGLRRALSRLGPYDHAAQGGRHGARRSRAPCSSQPEP